MSARESVDRMRKHFEAVRRNPKTAAGSPYENKESFAAFKLREQDEQTIILAAISLGPSVWPRPDDAEPLTEEWLQSIKAQQGGLCYSILLPTAGELQAIIEVEIVPPVVPGDEWDVSLVQNAGPVDDPSEIDDIVSITTRRFRTRGDLRAFFCGLGAPLQEPQ